VLQHNDQKLSALNRSLAHNPIPLSYIRTIQVFEDGQRVLEESTLMLPTERQVPDGSPRPVVVFASFLSKMHMLRELWLHDWIQNEGM